MTLNTAGLKKLDTTGLRPAGAPSGLNVEGLKKLDTTGLTAMPAIGRADPMSEDRSVPFGSLARGFNRLQQAGTIVQHETGLMSDEDAAKALVRDEADIARYPAPPAVQEGMKEISEAKGWGGAAYAILSNPQAVLSTIGESLPQSLAPLSGGIAGGAAGGAAGSVVPIVGNAAGATVGTIGGTFLGSFAGEYSATIIDTMRDHGVDFNDDAAVAAAFKDPAIMADARSHALKRGIPVAAFDAISFGVAGKIGKPVAELAMQAGTGAAGEASAQYVDDGEISKPGDVLMEGIAEVVSGVPEIGVGMAREARQGRLHSVNGVPEGAFPAEQMIGADPESDAAINSRIDDAFGQEMAGFDPTSRVDQAFAPPPPAVGQPVTPAPLDAGGLTPVVQNVQSPDVSRETNTEQAPPVADPSLIPVTDQPKGMAALVPEEKSFTIASGSADVSHVRPEVLDRFQQLQDTFGAQLPINSGFRDPERNAAAGGAKHSQHMDGNALDIDVRNMPIADRVRLIETASAAGFTGIGVYNNAIHIDLGARRYWGPSHSAESLPSWAADVIGRHMGGQIAQAPHRPGSTPISEIILGANDTRPNLDALLSDKRKLSEIVAERKAIADFVPTAKWQTVPNGAPTDGLETRTQDGVTMARFQPPAGTRESPLVIERPEDIHVNAEQTVAPTPGQAEAGNYRKRHVEWQGMPIAIETEAGQERTGIDGSGKPWSVQMPAPYGYLKRTKGADGDAVDVYLGHENTGHVFVVDQIDPATGKFDENKVMLGYNELQSAMDTYDAAFSDGSGPRRAGAVTGMTVAQFKQWLKNGEPKKPVAYSKPAAARGGGGVGATPDIVQFLAAAGGLQDYRGELRSLDLHNVFVPGAGRLMRSGGLTLDRAREMAEEAGYLGQAGQYQVSSIADMLNAIEATRRGQRIFARADQAKGAGIVAEQNTAKSREDEVKRELKQALASVGANLHPTELEEVHALIADGWWPDEAAAEVMERHMLAADAETAHIAPAKDQTDDAPFFAEDVAGRTDSARQDAAPARLDTTGLVRHRAQKPAPASVERGSTEPVGGQNPEPEVAAEPAQPAVAQPIAAPEPVKPPAPISPQAPSFYADLAPDERLRFDAAVQANKDVATLLGTKIDQMKASGDGARAVHLEGKLAEILAAMGVGSRLTPAAPRPRRAPITPDIAKRAIKILDEGFDWDAAVDEARRRAGGEAPRPAPSATEESNADYVEQVKYDLPAGYRFHRAGIETTLSGPDGKRIAFTDGQSQGIIDSMVATAREKADATKAETAKPVATPKPDERATAEPPVPNGMVRVYHSGQALGDGETGRWVSTNRTYAANYRSDLPLHYLDLPADDPRVNNPDYADQGVKQGFTFNFEVSADEAKRLRQINRTTEPSAKPTSAGLGKPKPIGEAPPIRTPRFDDGKAEEQRFALRDDGPTATPAFKKWFGDSLVVDNDGKPLVVYHGSNRQFQAFKPSPSMRQSPYGHEPVVSPAYFFTPEKATAQMFAKDRVKIDQRLRGKKGGRAQVRAFYLSVQNPLDLVISDGQLAEIESRGEYFVRADEPDPYATEIIDQIAGYRPETWADVQRALDDPDVINGLKSEGFDGVRLREDDGSDAWAVFEPTQIKSTDNSGSFDPADARVNYALREGNPRLITENFKIGDGSNLRTEILLADRFAAETDQIEAAMRKELDRLGLTDVGARLAQTIRFIVNGEAYPADGRYFKGLIDVALDAKDPDNVLQHEALHAMRRAGLFTDEEWQALSNTSVRDWMKRYTIPERYAGFPEWAQTEEGIAHAYADWATGKLNSGGLIARAFRKIKAFIEALRNALNGLGFKTSEDVFGKIGSGEIGRRPRAAAGEDAAYAIPSNDGDLFAKEVVETMDGPREQFIIPGADKISDKERAERLMQGRQRSGKPQRDASGLPLFGDEKDQMSMFQAAWHGSPHLFDKFSLGAIGTGEGAQSFGWGLYFAGKKEVAEFYREKLSSPDINALEEYFSAGRVVEGYVGYDKVLDFRRHHGGFSVQVVSTDKDGNVGQRSRPRWHSTIPDKSKIERVLGRKLGRLFQVEIPDDSELLAWDAPLSEQPEAVKTAIRSMVDAVKKPGLFTREPERTFRSSVRDILGGKEWDKTTGADLYGWLKGRLGSDRAASEAFRSAGIPGHKFLDGSSRSAGDGTYNYVIYDDARVEIDQMFKLRKEPETAADRQRVAQGFIARGQPIDRALRLPFQIFGGIDKQGQWKPGLYLSDKTAKLLTSATFNPEGRFSWLNGPMATARAGLVDRYGLDPAYIDRERKRALDERSIMMDGVEVLKSLKDQNVGMEEAKVLQAILTGEKVNDGDMTKLAEPIRVAIDELGQEAVSLGLLSPESFERNRGAYLHRVYAKHEMDGGMIGYVSKLMTSRRQRIVGDQFKGRGIFLDVEAPRLVRDDPAWASAGRGKPVKGEKFRILDMMQQQGDLLEPDAKPQAVQRVYLPADKPVPEKYAGWRDNGIWEIRADNGGKFTLWRDYSKTERASMGEILDARYTIGKTYLMMAHDLATGRFFKDIAENEEWVSTAPPATKWLNSEDFSRRAIDPEVGWVKVPDTAIGETGGTKRWGALAGKYVRAEIWRDINEFTIMNRPTFWRKALTQWKLNKTARSPVVHMNNVMSNLMFMDFADIRMQDLAAGVKSFYAKDQHYREAIENGAFGGDMMTQEVRDKVLRPILDEIAKAESDIPGVASNVRTLSRVADRLWGWAKTADRFTIEAYRIEDELFRMATYMRRRQAGDEPAQAADFARQQFLDYDIRAPWVNAARNSVLPFISYTYRAVPLIARAMATRPWKLPKYFLIAYALNALAYGWDDDGDDEERERASLRDEEQGFTWLGVPRMMRMPFRDGNGLPMFLDIRRWIPAGDVFDTNQGSSAIPIPAPLQFGGPFMMAAELALNKQGFTGEPITNDLTDNWWDKAGKNGDYLWKAWMPSAAWVPGSWYWTKIENSLKGATDSKGRTYDLPSAIASSVGVKVKAQDVEEGLFWHGFDMKKVEQELRAQARALGRQRERNLISQAEFERSMSSIMTKMDALAEKRAELGRVAGGGDDETDGGED
ncbi:D-Ala-D-Ala carboxypeptidase family metallohydrolase [Mesorhizobium sp. M0028]|uniref:ADP-ribosyltransferase-containing protein n=1 Tax=Mesorhizobium sp. M0028 TaxID=2956849 RepID=UPI00333AD745